MLDPIFNELADKVNKEFPVCLENVFGFEMKSCIL